MALENARKMNITDAERIRKLLKESWEHHHPANHSRDEYSHLKLPDDSFEKLHEATSLLLEKLIESDSQVNRVVSSLF